MTALWWSKNHETMTLYRNTYLVESTRLRRWDYANAGCYFVTICTRDREPFLGDVLGGEVRLSTIGEIAQNGWREIPGHCPSAGLDEFVVMPNHIHGIVVIDDRDAEQHRDIAGGRDVACNVSTPDQNTSRISPRPGSLSAIIRSYKSAVTRQVRQSGRRDFAWQPRFYEHIIRNDKSLCKIRCYIRNNPLEWDKDRNNPVNSRA